MAEPDPNREIDDEHTRATKARSQVAPAEARALGTLAILAIASILCVVVPVGIGVLLGTLLAFTTYDAAYMPLVRRTGKPALAAFAITAVTSLAVGAAIAAVVYLLILQGVTVAMRLPDLFSPGGRGAELVDHWRAPLGALKLDPASAVERLRGALGGVAAKLGMGC